MSSESQDTGGLDRRAEAARLFKAATAKETKSRKDNAFWRSSRELFRSVAPAFGLEPSDISAAWRENYSPDVVEIFKGTAEGSAMGEVFAFPHKYTQKTFLDMITKDSLTESRLWSYLTRCLELHESPVIVFAVGNTKWVMLTQGKMNDLTIRPFTPRIWVPLREPGKNVYLLSADKFLEEYK